jgi:peptidoglycan/xylan/chitin deacetylase (PgdA/CDA1 family)
MRLAAHRIRIAAAYVLYATGLLWLWQAITLRRRAVVLMYHRVLTPDERQRTGSHPGIVVHHDTFARQMAVLKRHFHVLTIEEFVARIEGKVPFENSSCLITFDDGWRDTYTNALPILQQYGLPAIVFLPVNFIGARRLFWREALTHILLEAGSLIKREPSRRPWFRDLLVGAGLEGALEAAESGRRDAVVAALAYSKPRTQAARDLPETLARELGIAMKDSPDGFIDWEQVASMVRSGVAFGGHGAEHRLLADVSSAEADTEIRVSKAMADQKVGSAALAFTYPDGSCNVEVAALVRAAGYRLAFTTKPGTVGRGDHPFMLRRVNIHEDMTSHTPMFLARLTGLL